MSIHNNYIIVHVHASNNKKWPRTDRGTNKILHVTVGRLGVASSPSFCTYDHCRSKIIRGIVVWKEGEPGDEEYRKAHVSLVPRVSLILHNNSTYDI